MHGARVRSVRIGAVLAACGSLWASRPAGAQSCPVDVELTACNTYHQVEADTTNHGSSYTCDARSYPGAEVTYQVTPPAGQEVVAFIENGPDEVALDLIVQKGDCGEVGACEGASMAVGNTEEVTWVADGSTYFVTVDDANGFGGYGFTFSLGCPTTCDLSDAVQSISCSTNISSTTAGGTSALDYYACGQPYSHLAQPNPEAIYLFTPQTTGEVTFTLDNLTSDQDLYVLADSCDPASCIASSTDLSTNVDSVTFEAQAGATYFIVVEAFEGPATYDLAFAIGPGGGCPEDCDNAVDDDLDGDTDCDDVDCQQDLVCCDGDADGFCGDDCAPDDASVHPGATESCDGADNDCDGAADEGACGPDAGPDPADAGPAPPDHGDAGDDGVPGPDSGYGVGGGAADDGCGCRAGTGASPTGLLVLLLAAAILRPRRRAR